METVKGYVEHIVFRNEDNGYTVFNLNNDDGDLTCVGNFNYLSEGELVEVNGEYVVHSVYGTQLRVLNYEIKAPEDLLSIERYLGSGAIKGVGASLAGRIVKKFREDTFRIIEEEPERLAEMRGISERMAREERSKRTLIINTLKTPLPCPENTYDFYKKHVHVFSETRTCFSRSKFRSKAIKILIKPLSLF